MRKDLGAAIDRNIRFLKDDVRAGALLHIKEISEIEPPPLKPLEDWQFPRDCRAYLDARIARARLLWEGRAGVADNAIPHMAPYYGIAEHSSFVGGAVRYGGNTSYHLPPLTNWDAFGELRLNENNENFQMLLGSMRYLKERAAEEGFLPALRGAEAPMDMANALRGNDLFYDLYDDPENVHRLLEFCLTAGRWTLDHQLDIVGMVKGHTLSGAGILLPGRSIGHISEDASCLCSAALYEEFGLPYAGRLLKAYDFTQAHIHAMGRHVLPALSRLPNLQFIEISRDPNQPAPIRVFQEYEGFFSGKIAILNISLDELEREQAFLTRRKTVLWLHVDTLNEARRAVDLVKGINDGAIPP